MHDVRRQRNESASGDQRRAIPDSPGTLTAGDDASRQVPAQSEPGLRTGTPENDTQASRKPSAAERFRRRMEKWARRAASGVAGKPKPEPKPILASVHSDDSPQAFSRQWWGARVQVTPGGCFEWSLTRSSNGYGLLGAFGRKFLAHRKAYETLVGPIPNGMFVLHLCDNPPCVNPDHLVVGTCRDNSRHMVERGRCRSPLGEEHARSKLTNAQADDIRRRFDAGECPSGIAALFGVSPWTVVQIGRRTAWRHLLPDYDEREPADYTPLAVHTIPGQDGSCPHCGFKYPTRVRVGSSTRVRCVRCSSFIENTVEANGRRQTVGQWAKETGIARQCINTRIADGWDPALAVTTPKGARKADAHAAAGMRPRGSSQRKRK